MHVSIILSLRGMLVAFAQGRAAPALRRTVIWRSPTFLLSLKPFVQLLYKLQNPALGLGPEPPSITTEFKLLLKKKMANLLIDVNKLDANYYFKTFFH